MSYCSDHGSGMEARSPQMGFPGEPMLYTSCGAHNRLQTGAKPPITPHQAALDPLQVLPVLPGTATSQRNYPDPGNAEPARPASTMSGYNNYYQRLQSGTLSGFREPSREKTWSEKGSVTHKVAQSNSNHHYPDPGPPMFRAGRLGAPWRHIKQCRGNLGNHICFVDGCVKEDDHDYESSHAGTGRPEGVVYLPPAALEGNHNLTGHRGVPRATLPHRDSKYMANAKQGFKYWFEDKKPMPFSCRHSFGQAGTQLGLPGPSYSFPPLMRRHTFSR